MLTDHKELTKSYKDTKTAADAPVMLEFSPDIHDSPLYSFVSPSLAIRGIDYIVKVPYEHGRTVLHINIYPASGSGGAACAAVVAEMMASILVSDPALDVIGSYDAE